MAAANGSQAAAATSQCPVPTLRPPATGARGILTRRVANIPSSQEKLLDTESAWLGSNGRPGQGFKPMPDNLLGRLKEAAQIQLQGPTTPAKRATLSQETSIEETPVPVREPSVAAKDLQTAVESPGIERAALQTKPTTPDKAAKGPATARVATPKQSTPKRTTPAKTLSPRVLPASPSARATSVPEQNSTSTPSATRTRTPPETAANRPTAVTSGATAKVSALAATGELVSRSASPALSQRVSPVVPETRTTTITETTVVQTVEGEQALEPEDQQPPDDSPHSPDNWPDRLDSEDSSDSEGRSEGRMVDDDSSPSVMEVELPDALVERRSSILPRGRPGVSSRSVQHPPSSSPPPPGTPVAMLRRTNLQSSSRANINRGIPLAADIADAKTRSAEDRPKSGHSVAPQKPAQPRLHLMKLPVFPASSKPSLRARPSMADLRPNSLNSSRRSSLAGGSTRDPSTNPTGTPTPTRPRSNPRVDDAADMSRRQTSIPGATRAPAAAALRSPAKTLPASSPRGPKPLEQSRNAPLPSSPAVVASVTTMPTMPAEDAPSPEPQSEPQSSAPRTWMLPFDTFLAAYPDYKGDLEDFLRACYSLQHTTPGALPGFLFDDVVHAFLDYIEYVHGPPPADARPPQNLTQWYNLHATGLVCKKSVVTRENVASILRAYPDEVRAIAHNAAAPGKHAEAVVVGAADVAATSRTPAKSATAANANASPHTLLSQERSEQPHLQDLFTPLHSFPPGRPFPHEENQHTSSQDNSSGPPNSILQVLEELRGSNSTDDGGQRHRQGHAQSLHPHGLLGGDYNDGNTSLDHSLSQGLSSQDQGLGYTQEGSEAPLVQTRHLLETTQSSWLEYYKEQLELPSSPIASGLSPTGVDKWFYMMQSPQLTRPRLPSTQDLASHDKLVEETPARLEFSQKRTHREFDSSRSLPAADTAVTPRDKAWPASTVSRSSSPRQGAVVAYGATVKEVIVGDDVIEVGAVSHVEIEEDEEDEEETDLHDTTIMSVQSAVEPRRQPSPSPPPTKRSIALQQERRRATIAEPDIGMVARMAAAEEAKRAAPKRKLPPSMAGAAKPAAPTAAAVQAAAAAEEPPKKKKKKNRQSTGSDRALTVGEKFRKFLEKKLAGGASRNV
ncbi:hypothetical protein SCUCBS95973_009738 [Sporothrix curviconia]|uniref:Uncharacterized protein n=1 Tax=Sporothrix curviconia TaxID=1260050 RepID=A0ABP0CXF1_9PEZI